MLSRVEVVGPLCIEVVIFSPPPPPPSMTTHGPTTLDNAFTTLLQAARRRGLRSGERELAARRPPARRGVRGVPVLSRKSLSAAAGRGGRSGTSVFAGVCGNVCAAGEWRFPEKSVQLESGEYVFTENSVQLESGGLHVFVQESCFKNNSGFSSCRRRWSWTLCKRYIV